MGWSDNPDSAVSALPATGGELAKNDTGPADIATNPASNVVDLVAIADMEGVVQGAEDDGGCACASF